MQSRQNSLGHQRSSRFRDLGGILRLHIELFLAQICFAASFIFFRSEMPLLDLPEAMKPPEVTEKAAISSFHNWQQVVEQDWKRGL